MDATFKALKINYNYVHIISHVQLAATATIHKQCLYNCETIIYVHHTQECNIFHLHPPIGLVHPACTQAGEPRPWLALDTVLAVRSSMARDGTSTGNNMDREPGTRDCAVQCTCVIARLLNKFTLVIIKTVFEPVCMHAMCASSRLYPSVDLASPFSISSKGPV